MPVASNNTVKVAGASFFLFCLALFLSSYSAKKPEIAQLGKKIVAEFTLPIQQFTISLQQGISGVWDSYVALVDVKQQNDQLKSRLSALEGENSRLLEFEHENHRLKNLLGILENTALKGVAAAVVGHNPSNWVQSVTIDRGEEHGLRQGMPVIESQGVVGQIIAVNRRSSEVLLVTDHASGVDAIVQRTRTRGVVEGSGGRLCSLRYVVKEEELKVGDRIITSGLDGIFPKGLLIGIISRLDTNRGAMFQNIEINPEVEFTRLENVLVITGGNTEAQAVVSPPENSKREKK